MPYFKTITNQPIPAPVQEEIKQELGQLAAILGKSENYLMVDFAGEAPLYFAGSDAPAALFSADVFGIGRDDAYQSFTEAVTELLSAKLKVPADRIFVKYNEYKHWGWNGNNF